MKESREKEDDDKEYNEQSKEEKKRKKKEKESMARICIPLNFKGWMQCSIQQLSGTIQSQWKMKRKRERGVVLS